MDRVGITARQAQVFAFVRTAIEGNGYSPSMVEIGDGMGMSSSNASAIVSRLVERGWLLRVPGYPRSLIVVEDAT